MRLHEQSTFPRFDFLLEPFGTDGVTLPFTMLGILPTFALGPIEVAYEFCGLQFFFIVHQELFLLLKEQCLAL